jgi:uncharacterized membrane protein
MAVLGVVTLAAGLLVARRQLTFLALAPIFFATALAMFAPEHWNGPEFVAEMVPSWMPARAFWAPFIGGALLAAATSLALRRFVALSSALLALMFFIFVCTIYAPSAVRNYGEPLAWVFVLRDLSFCAGACALTGRRPLVLFARAVITVAALFYGVEHVRRVGVAPGVPMEVPMPSWVPFPAAWDYATGAILIGAGVALAVNVRPRLAAAAIGAWMTLLTLFPYLADIAVTAGGSADELNGSLNFVADTLLYAGSALSLAAALPASRR